MISKNLVALQVELSSGKQGSQTCETSLEHGWDRALLALTGPATQRIVWQEIFGSEAPVEVEIGCGKGKFLLARALENPAVHFLGIDRVVKWMKPRLKQAEKLQLLNVKFVKAEAGGFIQKIPDTSVQRFHIYFPDPWPKRRHRRRRLVKENFLLLLYERLVPGGSIYLATDDADYFLQMKKSAQLLKVPCHIQESRERTIGPVKTTYELRFETAGLPLYYLEVRKP